MKSVDLDIGLRCLFRIFKKSQHLSSHQREMLALRLTEGAKIQFVTSGRQELSKQLCRCFYTNILARSQAQSALKTEAMGFKAVFAILSASSRMGAKRILSGTSLPKGNISRCGVYQHFQQRTFASMKRPFEINQNIPKDVLVYSHKNDSFYKMLSYFGLFQLVMWGYMALFAVQHLKKIPTAAIDTTDLPWWKRFLYKEGQYKNALSVLCLIIGGTVLFITMTYPRRAVRSLWILKGGKEVEITTYTWLGRTQTFRKPVDHIDCLQSRTGSGHHVPLKLKGKTFYFLLDKQGSFHNTDLFDYVIGVKRNLK